MGRIYTDKQIMESLLEKLQYNQSEYTSVLGYKKPSTISNILKERQGISKEMIKRIIHANPQVNYYFLKGADKKMFVTSPAEVRRNINIVSLNQMTKEDLLLAEMTEIKELLYKIINKIGA